MDKLKVDWTKIAKIAGFVLPAIGGIAGAWANSQENKKIAIESTEKLFKKYVENK